MTYKVFLIAGESSGDVLGASLIHALKNQRPDIEIRGIGGEEMIAAGLPASFFPMEELSVMGIAEILPRVPKFLNLISKTVQEIKGFNPDVVVTIDSPDFSFRVQKELKKQKLRARKIHYVAPSVWAWRPGRAEKIAQFLDGLICLFPFEVPYFERQGLRSISVGHSMVTSGVLSGDGSRFRANHDIPTSVKTLGLFCGSRRREIDMSLSIIKEVMHDLKAVYPDIFFVVPTLKKWEEKIRTGLSDEKNIIIVSDKNEKYDAFYACDAAVVVSGTVALEVALAGVPHVLFYKMNAITWEVVRRLVTSKFAHLGNVILGRKAFQEFLQNDARPDLISKVLNGYFSNLEEQTKIFSELSGEILSHIHPNPNEFPADIAAAFVLK